MTVQIEVEGRIVTFTLDGEHKRWRCLEEQRQWDFPLITMIDGKRYELYSDGKFAEVER